MNEENTNQENKPIAAFCDICDYSQSAPAESLRSIGWHLGSREQFCPNCND